MSLTSLPVLWKGYFLCEHFAFLFFSSTALVTAVNAVYNMGSHIQFVGKYKGSYDILSHIYTPSGTLSFISYPVVVPNYSQAH